MKIVLSVLILSFILVSGSSAFAHRKGAYTHTKKTHSFPYASQGSGR